MQGNVPHKAIKKKEYKHLLERLGFSLDVAQAIVHNHGYNTAKKLSHPTPNEFDILLKTLRSPGGKHQDGTKDHGISVPHSAQHVLTSCFILFHQVLCDLCQTINRTTDRNIYYLDLQCARGDNKKNNLYYKNRPKWDTADPEQSLINIHTTLSPFMIQTRLHALTCSKTKSSASCTEMKQLDIEAN